MVYNLLKERYIAIKIKIKKTKDKLAASKVNLIKIYILKNNY